MGRALLDQVEAVELCLTSATSRRCGPPVAGMPPRPSQGARSRGTFPILPFLCGSCATLAWLQRSCARNL